MEPASTSVFLVNRSEEKGHDDKTGLTRSSIARRAREEYTVVLRRVRERERKPPSISVG